MKYLLRTNVGQSGFAEISENYFNDLKQCYGVLLNAYHIEQTYDLVSGNFIEFESDVYQALLNYMVGRYPGWVNHLEIQLMINRRVSNLLSSCRTYFDQIYRYLLLCLDGDRSAVKSLRSYASALYDRDLDYRFMEALRNHVQHYALGVHQSSIGSKRVGDLSDFKVEHAVGFSVEKAELEKNNKFKPQVLAEIDDRVDVVSSTRGYIKNIDLVQVKARELLEEKIEKSYLTLLDAVGNEESRKGYFASVAICLNDEDNQVDQVPMTLSLHEEIMKLKVKNRAKSKFDKGYFTGTPLS